MKFIHIADLHIGKKLGAFDLLDDQRFAFNAIIDAVDRLSPHAVFVAGDIYDRSVPSADAVALADEFITRLAERARVFIVGGNHDSHTRLGFGSAIMRANGVYISREYAGTLEKIEMEDEHGALDIYMLPHIHPREAEVYFKEEAPDGFMSADDAVRAILKRESSLNDNKRRRVLIAHQFVRAADESPTTSDSEIHPIGGLSAVDVSAFEAFNYTALGHLHAPQKVACERVRYAGSPLKYSFSEARHIKSFVYGEIDARGEVKTVLERIPCLREVRIIEGTADELVNPAVARGENTDDYVCVRIKGVPPASPMEYLGARYSNIVKIEFEGNPDASWEFDAPYECSPIERFQAFYRLISGAEIPEDMLAQAIEAMDWAIKEARA